MQPTNIKLAATGTNKSRVVIANGTEACFELLGRLCRLKGQIAGIRAFPHGRAMRRFGIIAFLIIAIVPLTGCQMGFDLQIVGTPTEPDFVLSPYSEGLFGGSQPAVDHLSVGEVRDGQNHTVWAIARDPKCAATSHFHYGQTPAEWTAWTKPEPLQPGVTYVVGMSGCGFVGGRAFKILRSKIVSAEGDGDLPIKTVEAMK